MRRRAGRREHLAGRAHPTLESACDCAPFLGVGGFASEEKGVLDRLRQISPRRTCTDRDIAVRAAREGILLPVVVVVPPQLGADVELLAEEHLETRERLTRELTG